MDRFPIDKANLRKNVMAFTAVQISNGGAVNHKTIILRIWLFQLKLLYYFGISPYKPVYGSELEQWTLIRGNVFGQVLSAVLVWIPFHIHNVTAIILNFDSLYYHTKRTPKIYFDQLAGCLYFARNMVLFFVIQRRKGPMEEMMNKCYFSSFGKCLGEQENLKCSTNGMAQIYLGFVFLWQFGFTLVYTSSKYYSNEFTDWDSPSEVLDGLIQYGRFRFFLPIKENTSAVEDYVLGAFEFLVRCSYGLMRVITETLFVGTVPITLWLATKELQKFVDFHFANDELSIWNTNSGPLFSGYYELKEFSDSLNDIFSIVALLWLMGLCIDMAFDLDDSLVSKNVLDVVNIIALVACRLVATFLSGETYRMINGFKCWLMKPKNWDRITNQDEKEIRQRVLLELESGPVGFGCSGVYQVTYGFFAQVCVVMITIFLVSFENQSGEQVVKNTAE